MALTAFLTGVTEPIEFSFMFLAPARVREHQRQITGDGFVDPLIAITRPAHHVAPPLVCYFVKGN